jgi:hypothetical protein
MTTLMRAALVVVGFVLAVAGPASGQVSRFDELANLPFTGRFLSKGGVTSLKDELVVQRAVQTYLCFRPSTCTA